MNNTNNTKIELTPEELDILRYVLKVEISSFKGEELEDKDLQALISLIRKLDCQCSCNCKRKCK